MEVQNAVGHTAPKAADPVLPRLNLPVGDDLQALLRSLGKHQHELDAALDSVRHRCPEPENLDDLLSLQSNSPLEHGAKWLGERTDVGRDMWREIAYRLAMNVGFGPWNSHTRGTFPDIQHLAPKVDHLHTQGITVRLRSALMEKWPAQSTPASLTAGSGRHEGPREPSGIGNASKCMRRGRPPDTNAKDDAGIAAAWETGHYRTYAELGEEFRLDRRKVHLAVDRHRKRQKRTE